MKSWTNKILATVLFFSVVCSSLLVPNIAMAESQVTEKMMDDMFGGFEKQYLSEIDGRIEIHDKKDNIVTNNYGWAFAEMFEIVLDAYEHTGKAKYRDMIDKLFNNYISNEEDYWKINEYNDDIMWMVISCARAYNLTGNIKYKDRATTYFDIVFNRGCDVVKIDENSAPEYNGMWWTTDRKSKNSCICAPTVIAACLLGDIHKKESYFDIAKGIYSWQRDNLYDKNSGHVNDSIDLENNKVNTDWLTYNFGTFIGAATLLYEHFGTQMYLDDAIRTADYTKNIMFRNGVMNGEDDGGGDLSGFKGILVRWLYPLIVNHNQTQYIPWLELNAVTAYNNRNINNITRTCWNTKTSDTDPYISSFSASTAVSLMFNCPDTSTLVKNAFNKIQAEEFDSIKGAIAEVNCEDQTKNIGGVKDGYYTCYRNVDFGSTGADKAIIRYSAGENGGTIEIREGSFDGTLLGSAKVNSTGSWQNWSSMTVNLTRVTGLRDIFLVFKGTGYIANVNYFQFYTGAKDAFSTIGAESFETRSGGIVEPCADDGSTNLGAITNNCYTSYSVDFGSSKATVSEFRVSSIADGGWVDIYLGSTTGVKLGRMNLPNTGGWDKWDTVSCNLSGTLTGVQDIYLVYGRADSDFVLNLNYFKFYSNARKESYTIQAESYDYLSIGGIENCPEGGQNIGGVKNGSYALYKDVSFGDGHAKAYFRYSCGTYGGTVEIRSGSKTGTLIGTIEISNTGGWEKYSSTTCTLLNNVKGVHDVYLLFNGADYVLNLNNFRFSDY